MVFEHQRDNTLIYGILCKRPGLIRQDLWAAIRGEGEANRHFNETLDWMISNHIVHVDASDGTERLFAVMREPI